MPSLSSARARSIILEGTKPSSPGEPLPNLYFVSAADTASAALKFEIVASWGKARAATMTLPHVAASTPMFMPVGTQGTVKGLTSQQLEELDCHVCCARVLVWR